MARSIRIQFENAFYHVMARGNRREAVFADDDDRRFFVQTLGQGCGMTGWRVHAWVLMGNHYHLLVQTPQANLVAGMSWLQNTYTRRFNVRHRLWGRLFGDRYKAVVVEGGSGYHYETLLDYIHLNPVRAGIISPQQSQSVLDYPWSSVVAAYACLPSKRAGWMAVEEGLRAFGLTDTVKGRRSWVERLDRRASEELTQAGKTLPPSGDDEDSSNMDRRRSHLTRGWYWGTQAFAEQALRLAEAALKKPRHRNYQASSEHRAHGQEEAARIVREGLQGAGLTKSDLAALPGSDPRKVAIAVKLREQTCVSLAWISAELAMKSAANVSQQIRRHGTKV